MKKGASPKTPVLRLIRDVPRQAALNMAIDEVLMEAQKETLAQAALRFYGWEDTCYTVGYFQDLEAVREKAGRPGERCQWVRRITGGGAVRHGRDLTFSLSMSQTDPLFLRDVKSSYLKINEAVREGLKMKWPAVDYADCKTVPSGRGGKNNDRVCFEAASCYDLLIGGRKIVGASQRRTGGALLHQSSIFFEEAGRDELTALILSGFRARWHAEFEERPISGEELARAERKVRERYSSSRWALPVISYALV